MQYAEIYQKLKDKFGDSILQTCTDVVGDPYCVVKRDSLLDVCKFLKEDPELAFDYNSSVSGVDDGKTMWVVYHFYSLKKNHKAVLKVEVGRETPSVPSIMHLWRGANWHERETYDFYGIRFEGHSDLRRILLSDDWEGWPLRKDYEFPDDYHGIPLK